MHIAVCDDNVADRKQLERLLTRESDKRKSDSEAYYTDSYGNPEALCANPMAYDLFFIDLTQSDMDGLVLARRLRELGVTAPIVLCSSKIDYQKLCAQDPKDADDFMHLQKPILVAKLSEALDRGEVLAGDKTPTIELRSNTDSYYVREDDIMYAASDGRYINVFLRDGRRVAVLIDMYNFYDEVYMFSHFLMLSPKSLINIAYLESYSSFSVVMKDGTKLKSSPSAAKDIKNALLEYQKETL